VADKLSNVIEFPRFISDPPMTANEVKDKMTMYKESYANDLAEIIWENVLAEMSRANCDFDSDINEYFPNMILIFESIKALHLQTMGEDHPLIKFARENVAILETDGENTVGGLKTNLTNTEIEVDNDEDL
jgi:hypothetical protein